MRVLAFDLSLSNSGYAVGDIVDGVLTVVEYGSIGTKRIAKQGTGKRLHFIATEVKKLYAKFSPDRVAKERSFSNGRITATQQIYKVVGVWEMISHTAGIEEFTDITPPTVKKQLTGNGRASKEEVARAVKDYTGIETKINDESDAIAVLISYGKMEGIL